MATAGGTMTDGALHEAPEEFVGRSDASDGAAHESETGMGAPPPRSGVFSNPELRVGINLERSGRLSLALRSYQAARRDSDSWDVRAEALRRESDVYRALGQWDAAEESTALSKAIAEEHQLADRFPQATNAEGILRTCLGAPEQARELFQQVTQCTDDPKLLGLAYQNLGNLAAQAKDVSTAQKCFLRSYRYFKRAKFPRGAIYMLINVGGMMNDQNEHELAEPLFTGAMGEATNCGDSVLYAIAVINRGECRMRLGHFADALCDVGEALIEFGRGKDRQHRMVCVALMGELFRRRGDSYTARKYYSRALVLATELGLPEESEAYRGALASPEASRATA
jgi:tetratricopeptide (TPR) repeat protein